LLQENENVFALLKQEIAQVMKQSYPGICPDPSLWKGQEITDFQEDLLLKVNGRLSEKWFYTHIKSEAATLPRIDVLNMLSRYAGYANWDDFRFRNRELLPEPAVPRKSNYVFVLIPVIVLITAVILAGIYSLISTREYRFTFIDAETGEPLNGAQVHAELLLDGESPVSYTPDSMACIRIRTDRSLIRLAVSSPYYSTDTVIRSLKKFNRSEQIRMKPDPYALMLRYFSQTDVNAWQQRREKLEALFADDAMICCSSGTKENTGIELLTKQEFIDKLTMPVSGLKNLEVTETKYTDGRINLLRVRIKTKAE
jgi:hypothetical protein